MGKKRKGFHVEWKFLPFKFRANLWLAQESLQPYPFGPLTFLISTLQVECHSHFFRLTLLEVFRLTKKRLHLLQLIRRKTQGGILTSVNKKIQFKKSHFFSRFRVFLSVKAECSLGTFLTMTYLIISFYWSQVRCIVKTYCLKGESNSRERS